jgi:spore coat polysaccharide biosynthesis predicted glycosyltransferase SpsG
LNKKYNILICPLEWGLGHATRMIPLAKKLLEMDNNIFIGSGEEYLSLFRNELSGVSYINFTGFKPCYSRLLPQYLALLLNIPSLLFHIVLEHFRLKKIIRKYSIDIVISDNRFGLWNRKVTTAYITHMLLIPFPKTLRFLEFIGLFLHRMVVKKYSFCFVPDFQGKNNLSGRLSHGIKLPDNVRYIGILSRFYSSGTFTRENPVEFNHNTVILSGPEPQREILKQKLASCLKGENTSTVILEGRPDKKRGITSSGNIYYYTHLPASEMIEMITGSECIISRSGYTTIMELLSLNCTALLIPTPGQTEQEYLAEYLSKKGWFSTIPQSEIKAGITLPSNKAVFSCELIEHSGMLLTEALNELLGKHHKKD